MNPFNNILLQENLLDVRDSVSNLEHYSYVYFNIHKFAIHVLSRISCLNNEFESLEA